MVSLAYPTLREEREGWGTRHSVTGIELRGENDPAFIALAGPGLFDFGQRHRFDVNRKLELFGGGEHGT